MMLGFIGSNGKKMLPYLFTVGTKVNSEEYIKASKTVFKPWIQRYYELVSNHVLHQDGAPKHMS
jgi:hypothetical protein